MVASAIQDSVRRCAGVCWRHWV